jgi:hypothetical protein
MRLYLDKSQHEFIRTRGISFAKQVNEMSRAISTVLVETTKQAGLWVSPIF